MIIKTKAIVIKEYIVGESDKYVTLLTKDYGKIQALAPKAKKTDRGFASATQLFVYGDFILTSYKDTYRMVNAEIIEMFHGIREDLERLSYASYIMEFIQYVTEPMLSQPELLKLCIVTLQALSRKKVNCHLVRRVFELRALKELGFGIQLLACLDCGEVIPEEEDISYFFSPQAGGLVCNNCKTYYKDLIEISFSTRYTLAYIMNVGYKALYQFTITKPIQNELNEVCGKYMPYYIDKTFKTLDFIERIEAI